MGVDKRCGACKLVVLGDFDPKPTQTSLKIPGFRVSKAKGIDGLRFVKSGGCGLKAWGLGFRVENNNPQLRKSPAVRFRVLGGPGGSRVWSSGALGC